MAAATSRCDIIRDFERAAACGLCAAAPGAAPPPACAEGGAPPPAAVCAIPGAANARMRLFASRYAPASMFEGPVARLVRTREEQNFMATIAKAEAGLRAAYPGAPAAAAEVGWADFDACGVAAGGGPALGRAAALAGGMSPPYPLGGKLLAGKLWKTKPAPVPLAADYLMNPDLFVVVVVLLLVTLVAALVQRLLAARRARRVAAAAAARPRAQAACRAWVESQELRGAEMGVYRAQCGLPPKPPGGGGPPPAAPAPGP
jgi:hypothetical protein